VQLDSLELRSFRSYAHVRIDLVDGLTLVTGSNGSGKSNLLEAIGYLATQRSFRGHPIDAVVRTGSDRAVVRADGRDGDRQLLFEAEIVPGGRNRFFVNRQPLRRSRDLASMFRVSVFSPDDLELVKGGPAGRRDYLDDLLAAVHQRYGALQDDVDRVLRQRNALLKSAGGRLDESAEVTLDVWDAKFGEVGGRLALARQRLLDRLSPFLVEAYAVIAEGSGNQVVTTAYDAPWSAHPDGLTGALAAGRAEDVRRGLSLTGPHRDEVTLLIDGRPSRTHASQGEQRTLALALRLAGHRLLAEETGSVPVLLLDDVFSELDPQRCSALIRHLPVGQAVLASAQPPPADVGPHATVVARLGVGGTALAGDGITQDTIDVDNPGETVDESALDHTHQRQMTPELPKGEQNRDGAP
jgi:DNA replication and repair protein RecF